MRDQLFLAISDRLNQEVPELVHIDMDWGQLEVPEEWYPIMFDAALISFPNIPWQTFPKKYQEGVVTVMVRVAVEMITDTHIADSVVAPDRAASILKMQLVNKVFKALQGFEIPEKFGPLVRTSSVEEQRQDGLKVWQEYYTTRLKDFSAMATINEVAGSALNLSADLSPSLP